MEIGMILLAITATLSSLATEAIKHTLNIDSKKTSLNVLVAVVAIICALLVSFGYIIIAGIALTPKIGVYIVALSLLSWISACCGYDKVMQLIGQISTVKGSNQ